RLLFREGESVGARIEIHVREVRLDVCAHLDGALVEERLAVVEEIDPDERRPRLVDDLAEHVEVQHAGLPRPRDAGLWRAAGLIAGDVARGRALYIEPRW